MAHTRKQNASHSCSQRPCEPSEIARDSAWIPPMTAWLVFHRSCRARCQSFHSPKQSHVSRFDIAIRMQNQLQPQSSETKSANRKSRNRIRQMRACDRKLETPKTRHNSGIESPIHPLRWWALHLRTLDYSKDLLPNYPMSDILETCLRKVSAFLSHEGTTSHSG